MADKLFAELDENHQSQRRKRIPKIGKIRNTEKSFSKNIRSALSYDDDFMIGPYDWDSELQIGDYVQRRKAYIYDWTKDGLLHARS